MCPSASVPNEIIEYQDFPFVSSYLTGALSKTKTNFVHYPFILRTLILFQTHLNDILHEDSHTHTHYYRKPFFGRKIQVLFNHINKCRILYIYIYKSWLYNYTASYDYFYKTGRHKARLHSNNLISKPTSQL